MKRPLRCLVLSVFCATQYVHARGIVHVSGGDCAALTAAAAAAPGQEPTLIVLARDASYGACTLSVQGTIAIDGAGAHMPLIENPVNAGYQIAVASGAQLTIHNMNFGAAAASGNATLTPKFLDFYVKAIHNAGTLVLDGDSFANELLGYRDITKIGGGFIENGGALSIRNSTFTEFADNSGLFTGDVELVHVTVANTTTRGNAALGDGHFSVANSAFEVAHGSVCYSASGSTTQYLSRGGNVTSDASCGFGAANDRVVTDLRLLDAGTRGGVVITRALNYDSPAIGNGLAANCEASDARGFVRGVSHCDSGAYEFGGGIGRLDATGASGLYYNPANDGHYVTVQRLGGDDALVIWNTFDQHGTPAWLYGVGKVHARTISVDQVAQSVGGTLQPGGNVVGATATLWGSFQFHLDDCMSGSLSYASPLPAFGSGTTHLQRLALLGGVDCGQ